MSLQKWADNGWLRAHRTSRQEIGDLLKIVERDLHDARSTGLSEDWRFGIAYNAALKLCTILLYTKGFRAEKTLQHYRTIQALPLILGPKRRGDADYLDACRSKRNVVEYDRTDAVSAGEAQELLAFVVELRDDVRRWLEERHADLMK
ncbi:MAG: hypothetical protein U1D97_06420 [Desulfuromonadales bacterium]|nr:hypothetical protein [Desulfuromonadales bacterium]